MAVKRWLVSVYSVVTKNTAHQKWQKSKVAWSYSTILFVWNRKTFRVDSRAALSVGRWLLRFSLYWMMTSLFAVVRRLGSRWKDDVCISGHVSAHCYDSSTSAHSWTHCQHAHPRLYQSQAARCATQWLLTCCMLTVCHQTVPPLLMLFSRTVLSTLSPYLRYSCLLVKMQICKKVFFVAITMAQNSLSDSVRNLIHYLTVSSMI